MKLHIPTKILKTILFIFIIYATGLSDIYGEEPQHLSSFHSEQGKRLFQEGNFPIAQRHLIDALLFDASNEIAIKYLQMIGEQYKGLADEQHHHLFRFIELIEYSRFLRNQLHSLDSQNTIMINFIFDKGKSDSDVVKQAGFLQSDIQDRHRLYGDDDLTTRIGSDHEPDIIILNDELVKRNRNFTEHLDALRDIYEELKSLKWQIIQGLSREKKKGLAGKAEPDIQNIQTQLIQKDRAIEEQEKNFIAFREEIKTVRLEFENVKAKLKQTDRRVVDLTRDLAGRSLEVFEKNKIIADKDTRFKTLESDLIDTRERLNLVQRIMQEKDEHIGRLEDEIVKIQTRLSKESQPGEEGMQALKQDLFQLQDDLQVQSKSSLEQILALDQQFQDLNKRYQLLETQIHDKEKEVFQLKETLVNKDRRILNLKKVFVSKDQKLMELNGIVQIYKGRLGDTHVALQERDERLNQLEQILMDFQTHYPAEEGNDESKIKPQGENLLEIQGPEEIRRFNQFDIWSHRDILERTKIEVNALMPYFLKD